MPEKIKGIKIDNPNGVPINRKGRIKKIKSMPNDAKEPFLPPIGGTFLLGPYKFKVISKNIKDMKFSVELHDIIIEGVND